MHVALFSRNVISAKVIILLGSVWRSETVETFDKTYRFKGSFNKATIVQVALSTMMLI